METGRMNRITPEIWTRLEQGRPAGDNLTARQVIPNINNRLQCALDSEGMRHLLIALYSDDETLYDTQSRGLNVTTRDLVIHSEPPEQYIDIQCLDPIGHTFFDLIGDELADELSKPRSKAAEAVKRVLGRWRRFWGQLHRPLLTKEEMVGLFGELWFLLVWLLPSVGIAESIQRWCGPLGSRHDFEWMWKSLEVKTTTSTHGCIHWISSLDQLSPPEIGELLFFSLHLREEAGAVNTLPLLIKTIFTQLNSNFEASDRFETILANIGYSPAHDAEYSKIHFHIIDQSLFAVREDFPRLVPQQFSTGIPKGIERVKYEINISTFDHLRIARQPSEAQSYLI